MPPRTIVVTADRLFPQAPTARVHVGPGLVSTEISAATRRELWVSGWCHGPLISGPFVASGERQNEVGEYRSWHAVVA